MTQAQRNTVRSCKPNPVNGAGEEPAGEASDIRGITYNKERTLFPGNQPEIALLDKIQPDRTNSQSRSVQSNPQAAGITNGSPVSTDWTLKKSLQNSPAYSPRYSFSVFFSLVNLRVVPLIHPLVNQSMRRLC